VDAGRLGNGAVVAGVAALIVLIGLFLLDWYSVDESAIAPVQIEHSYLAGSPSQMPNDLTVSNPPGFSAWDSAGFLGTIANLIILAAALGALGIAYSMGRGSPLSAGAAPTLLLLGGAAALMVVLRMIFPVEDFTSLDTGIWVTLAGTLGVAAGAAAQRRPTS
jgi:hypothetical protein